MDRYSAERLGAFKSVNPVMRVVYAVLGLGVFGVMLALGTIFFVAFAAIALIGGSFVAARLWWLSRKAEKNLSGAFESMRSQMPGQGQGETGDGGSVIEGEFVVIDSESNTDSHPRGDEPGR